MPRPRTFSLCADDYAMTPGVTRGILEALEARALSATSVMTTSPWWPEHARALKPHEGQIDIGLHLNLTLGAPLGPMPSLSPGGTLPGIRTLMRLQRTGRLPLPEIAAEIGRQCDRFAAVFGRAPDHVDGHQHVQALRAIRPLVYAALEQRGWRPWLRDSTDRLWRIPWRGAAKKALALSIIGEGSGREAARRGFVCNEGFAGFSTFDPSADYAALFASYLKAPGTRHLVMCHPGYADDALRALDPVVETREQELEFLTSAAFARLLDRRSTRLARMDVSGRPAAGLKRD